MPCVLNGASGNCRPTNSANQEDFDFKWLQALANYVGVGVGGSEDFAQRFILFKFL
jgi:hypothetical protein